jgi:hypothetical protein
MATTPFSSKVLWGASRPSFSLIGGEDVIQRLAGTWTWTEGSTAVTVDTDITDDVVAGERIKAFDNGKFWTISTISYDSGTEITTIALKIAFDESPNLVVNGNFAAWTGVAHADSPDNWTVQNETLPSTNYVTESTATCRIVDAAGGNDVGIFQSILTANQQYKVTLDIDARVSGGIVIDIGSRNAAFATTGAKEWIATPANTKLLIRSKTSGASDVTFDDVVAIRYSTQAFVERGRAVTLPHTSDTVFSFEPERNDGGSPTITLESGEIIGREDGFRATITFTWRRMNRYEFKKIIQIRNWLTVGQIMLVPHEDATIQFDVIPVGSLSPSSVGDLFDGHAVTETYVSRKLIKSIPTTEAVSGAHPIVF